MADGSAPCAARPAAQPAPGIGHNGGPRSEPYGLRAAWLRFADAVELRRLAQLQARIERRKRGLADLQAEQRKIMQRCVRRMRRAEGKE